MIGAIQKEKALKAMQECKAFLDTFLAGKTELAPVFPDIKEALKEKPDLPITVQNDGLIEINVGIGMYDHFYYGAVYDIDNDIANITKMETYDDSVHMTHADYEDAKKAIDILENLQALIDRFDSDILCDAIDVLHESLERAVITEER